MDESDFGMLKSVAQHSALLIKAEGESHQDGAGCDSKASKLVCVFVLRYGTISLTDSGHLRKPGPLKRWFSPSG
jgi:hypothetical protein